MNIFRKFAAILFVVHWRRNVVTLLVVGFVALNVLAYRHARAMLVYDPAISVKPPAPGGLSFGEKCKVLLCGVQVPRPTVTRTPADVGLAFESVSFTADDGVHLAGWLMLPADNAPRGTVLIFHGYSASRSNLVDEARSIVELGYAALLVDFRGCGESDGNATTLGYDEARDVQAAVAFVRSRQLPGPTVLYGQSLGAAAVLRAVGVAGVSVDGIVLESVFGRMLGTVRNRFATMHVPSWPAAELLVFWGGRQTGFSGFEHNPEEYAARCTCPALLLHGSADPHARLDECQAVADHLPGRHTTVVFDGAGHESLHHADDPKWTAAVRTFLESLP